jgi:hypothetical protein
MIPYCEYSLTYADVVSTRGQLMLRSVPLSTLPLGGLLSFVVTAQPDGGHGRVRTTEIDPEDPSVVGWGLTQHQALPAKPS